MAQWLRALTALPEGLNSIPSKHMVAHNHLYWDVVPSSGMQVYMQTEHSYIEKGRERGRDGTVWSSIFFTESGVMAHIFNLRPRQAETSGSL
jgi:hypothetical protein